MVLTAIFDQLSRRIFDKYSFIANRLRAVRQELTIQRLSSTWFGVKLLIGCCNFYLVSRRIFADFKSEENFIDLPKFNENHLKECISTIINFLSGVENDELFGAEIGTTREAIAILLLSSFEELTAANLVLDFVLSKMNELKSHNIILNPLSLFRSFYHKNWTRFSRAFHRLSRIQQITVEPHVATIRRYTLQSCALAYHNQRLPLSVLANWLIQSRQETQELINETAGLDIKRSQDGSFEVQFNKKEFDLDTIPDDVLTTRAAGALSQQVLFDMCQVADYEESVLVAEITENADKIEITDEAPITQNKEAVSINPLDVAASASSDEDSIPIWMRPKAKTNNRRNRPRNGGNAEPRARHNSSNNPPRQRRSSNRSRERREQRDSQPQKRNNRKFENGSSRGHGQPTRGKKPGSTASRSWQHDDRTRTAY